MGQRASDQVTVKAPPGVVMGVITDLEAYPDWAEGMKKVTVTERDDEGRPSVAAFEVDAKVAEVDYDLAYTYGDNRVDWTLTRGEVLTQLDGSYVLEERGDTTHVTYTLEADIAIPLPGFMKKRAAKQILDTGLKGLRERAESVARGA